jgi:hypothetical protein
VHSMNCEHHNIYLISYNELMCTAYSPKFACEWFVNNKNEPIKSMF